MDVDEAGHDAEPEPEPEVVPQVTLQKAGNVKSRRIIENCWDLKNDWTKKKAVPMRRAEAEVRLKELNAQKEAEEGRWKERTFPFQVRLGRPRSAAGVLYDDKNAKRHLLNEINAKSIDFKFTCINDATAEVIEMLFDGRLVLREDAPARPAVPVPDPAGLISPEQPLLCTTVYGKGKPALGERVIQMSDANKPNGLAQYNTYRGSFEDISAESQMRWIVETVTLLDFIVKWRRGGDVRPIIDAWLQHRTPTLPLELRHTTPKKGCSCRLGSAGCMCTKAGASEAMVVEAGLQSAQKKRKKSAIDASQEAHALTQEDLEQWDSSRLRDSMRDILLGPAGRDGAIATLTGLSNSNLTLQRKLQIQNGHHGESLQLLSGKTSQRYGSQGLDMLISARLRLRHVDDIAGVCEGAITVCPAATMDDTLRLLDKEGWVDKAPKVLDPYDNNLPACVFMSVRWSGDAVPLLKSTGAQLSWHGLTFGLGQSNMHELRWLGITGMFLGNESERGYTQVMGTVPQFFQELLANGHQYQREDGTMLCVRIKGGRIIKVFDKKTHNLLTGRHCAMAERQMCTYCSCRNSQLHCMGRARRQLQQREHAQSLLDGDVESCANDGTPSVHHHRGMDGLNRSQQAWISCVMHGIIQINARNGVCLAGLCHVIGGKGMVSGVGGLEEKLKDTVTSRISFRHLLVGQAKVDVYKVSKVPGKMQHKFMRGIRQVVPELFADARHSENVRHYEQSQYGQNVPEGSLQQWLETFFELMEVMDMFFCHATPAHARVFLRKGDDGKPAPVQQLLDMLEKYFVHLFSVDRGKGKRPPITPYIHEMFAHWVENLELLKGMGINMDPEDEAKLLSLWIHCQQNVEGEQKELLGDARNNCNLADPSKIPESLLLRQKRKQLGLDQLNHEKDAHMAR